MFVTVLVELRISELFEMVELLVLTRDVVLAADGTLDVSMSLSAGRVVW